MLWLSVIFDLQKAKASACRVEYKLRKWPHWTKWNPAVGQH